jgi:hypothetical protein
MNRSEGNSELGVSKNGPGGLPKRGHFFFNSAVQLEMSVRVLEGWLPS